jgi:hypothetical protein
MTDLSKKISRRVNLPLDNRIGVRDRDRITVTLYPDGYIGFRAHKRRREYQLPLSICYKKAIELAVEEERKIRAQEKRIRLGRKEPTFKVRRSVI